LKAARGKEEHECGRDKIPSKELMKLRYFAGSLAMNRLSVRHQGVEERLYLGTTAEMTYTIILFCLLFHSILTLRDYVLDLGHPYLWVQKLGGLHFPKEQPQVCTLTLPPWLRASTSCWIDSRKPSGLLGLWSAECLSLGL
jgi:hypothetical protein